MQQNLQPTIPCKPNQYEKKAKDEWKCVKQCEWFRYRIKIKRLQADAPGAKQQCAKPNTLHTGTIRTSLPTEQFWDMAHYLFVSLMSILPKWSGLTDLRWQSSGNVQSIYSPQ